MTKFALTPIVLIYPRSLGYQIAVRYLITSLATVYLMVHCSTHIFYCPLFYMFQCSIPIFQFSSNLSVLKCTTSSVFNYRPQRNGDTLLMLQSLVSTLVYHKVHYDLIRLLTSICVALGLVYCMVHHYLFNSLPTLYNLIHCILQIVSFQY